MAVQLSNPESVMNARRAFFQFSLRTLIVVVTFFALLFAICRIFVPSDLDPILATLAVSSLIIKGTMWFLIVAFGTWAYRRFQCPSLPWLGIYAAVAIPLSVIMPLFLKALVDGRLWVSTSVTIGEFLVRCAYADMLIQSLITLILATMILAEIAALIARVYAGLDFAWFRLLLAAREKAILLGAVLVTLTLAAPFCAAVLWFAS
jgi:hypothetical protein